MMEQWRERLYGAYVSSGQSARDIRSDRKTLKPSQHTPFLARHAPKDRSMRILDLGCGHGSLLNSLKKLGYTNIEGIDLSAEQVALAHRLGILEAKEGELIAFLKSQPPGEVNAVCLMDVLEHVDRETLLLLLDEVHRVLAPTGTLLLHIPNGEGIFGLRMRYGDLTHELTFTPRSIQQVLNTCGFHHIKILEDKPPKTTAKSLIRRVAWEILRIFPRLLFIAETGELNPVLTQNMYVTAKKKSTIPNP